ncbi:putative ABC transport system ATP-binding protein [Catenibacillus scindens]|uniref:Putative ABC transport system ATP-binding protein n=1 Tax=Catenibacillus scindens TaxID=673271 RepID=A0A7W8H975_9FIRM|nr:ABC transporter ATP-binding protein [Catenibacillus scindens]MBB5263472.1 putative ABC transport system ATP-binding protein [Catenibacillus scindens]
MILEAKNVLYSYKSKRDKIVLKNVSATFEEATFYAIVGSSGSGKTTFLSLLAGLDHPVSGNILYGGEDIRKKGLNYHRRHNVSLVFQNYNLIDYLTTEENVKLGGRKNAGELLREVSIFREDWKRNVLQLSGGQQQRVAIARALASEAKVLLADEPTGNLDEDTAQDITEILKESAHKMNKCVVVVTHSGELAKQADVVFRMKNGELQVLERIDDSSAQPRS